MPWKNGRDVHPLHEGKCPNDGTSRGNTQVIELWLHPLRGASGKDVRHGGRHERSDRKKHGRRHPPRHCPRDCCCHHLSCRGGGGLCSRVRSVSAKVSDPCTTNAAGPLPGSERARRFDAATRQATRQARASRVTVYRYRSHGMLFFFISWDACMSCMHLMLVSPARRRIGLDSAGRGVAPAALNVVRSGRQPIYLR